MKKFKWLTLLLALVLLLSSCTVITSTVQGENDPPAEDEGVEGDDQTNTDSKEYRGVIDVNKFKMIYARSASNMMQAKITTYQDNVKNKTGGELLASKDKDKMTSKLDTADFEILVGRTSRKQSSEAYAMLGGKTGFVVAQIGNKIVINGTSDYMVDLAWQHFYTEFVLKANTTTGKVNMEKDYCYVETNFNLQDVASKNNIFVIVYSDKVDSSSNSDYNSTPNDKYVDYLYKQVLALRTKWASVCNQSEDAIALGTDRADQSKTGIELLVGQTTRSVSTELMGALAADEYGVLCRSRQIAIGGWSDESVVNAINHLTLVLEFCTDYDSGAVRMPIGEIFSASRTAYPGGVPSFEGGSLVGVVESGSGKLENDAENSTFQECYSDCTVQQYEKYCATLLGAGFSLYYQSENKNTDSNLSNYYRTYVNDTSLVHVYFIGEMEIVRVVISSLENVNLPNIAKENYTKVTEPKLTQMRFAYDTGNFGLCTILTLEDGSFIIYDGGGEGKDGKVANDQIRLYNLLKQLNTRPDGKIVISAWILTHQHWDHYYNFYRFCEKYGKEVTVEQYICNLSSSSYKYNSYNPDGYGITNLIKVRDQFMAEPFDIVEVHTGQTVRVRNVDVEILFTQEDMYPSPLYYFNNSTLVTRLHVNRTVATVGQQVDANTARFSTTSVLMLGDQNHEGAHHMLDMYGQNVKANATLKSDIVQVAHHGVNGAITEVYNVADPTLLLWPTSRKNYNSWTNGKAGGNTTCHYEGCLGDDGVASSDDGKHSYKIIDKRLRDKIDAGQLELILADEANWTIDFPWAPGNNIYMTDDLGVSGNGTYNER